MRYRTMSGDPGHDRYDLHRLNRNCEKNNNNHEGFTLRENFNSDDIPDRFRGNPDMLDLIEQLCQLTVKLNVAHRSAHRQDPKNETDDNINGIIQGCQGSGRIQDVKDVNESSPGHESGCASKNSRGRLHRITVQTSKHVVFDETEAEHTECIINFNGPNSFPHLILDRCFMSSSDANKDSCLLEFDVSDSETIESIKSAINKFKVLSDKLQVRYSKVKDEDRLCVVVSHPHGCYKYISFGTWRKDDDGYYTYTAKTCPASSGGSLILIGINANDLVHMGWNSSGLNCSSFAEEGAGLLVAGHGY
ncbi:hypothetical protein Btru_012365 [Bulinus truncatus]|nr:hypothetical protein Btru_012365 [Bulinus truncatus]